MTIEWRECRNCGKPIVIRKDEPDAVWWHGDPWTSIPVLRRTCRAASFDGSNWDERFDARHGPVAEPVEANRERRVNHAR